MKKAMKMMSFALAMVLLLALAACGGAGDALKGKWSGADDTYGTVTWEFDGKGGCSMTSDYFSGKGTYTIENETVSIKLEAWDSPNEYTFQIADNKLDLTSVTGIAPNYSGLAKQ